MPAPEELTGCGQAELARRFQLVWKPSSTTCSRAQLINLISVPESLTNPFDSLQHTPTIDAVFVRVWPEISAVFAAEHGLWPQHGFGSGRSFWCCRGTLDVLCDL